MLVQSFVLFICCLSGVYGSERAGFPGYVYYPEVSGWLKMHQEPMDWQEARITCHLEDALLAADWNPEMRSAINKLQASSESPYQSLYAGAEVKMTLSDEGFFTYLEGEPILTASTGGLRRIERCAVFNANGTVGENDCEQKLNYTCFAPAPACGIDSYGYNFANETDHCYKVHSEDKNWLNAYRTCADEGAYLSVINNEDEAKLVTELFNKNTDSEESFAAIGFYYWEFASSWWTINGQTIDQAGFTRWREGEPTLEVHPRAVGGLLHRDGTLYSHYIDKEVPFICEKNPIFITM